MFFEFGIKDFTDILLAAFLLYYTYKLMKASGSIKVFTGILVFILIWLVVTQVLEMKLLGSIFDTLMNVGRDSADRTVSGRDTPFLADFGFSPACQCIGPSL